MTERNSRKLNQLEQALPEGLIVDAGWLEERGYSRSLRSQYVAAGWLKQPARGIFCRPRGALGWEQVVISLQALLGLPVWVGGRSALELQGYAHYLSQAAPIIHLYSEKPRPGWVAKLPVEARFEWHRRKRILPPAPLEEPVPLSTAGSSEKALSGGLRLTRWGPWNWPLVIAGAERAILELIDELPSAESFHGIDVLMEGLVDLSPRRLQSLLEQTDSVKVKRLFFFFADRHQHRWLAHLDTSRLDFGKGKRALVKSGILNRKYQITVPGEFDGN